VSITVHRGTTGPERRCAAACPVVLLRPATGRRRCSAAGSRSRLPVHADAATGGELVRHPVEVTARYSTTMSFRFPGADRTTGTARRRGTAGAGDRPLDQSMPETGGRAGPRSPLPNTAWPSRSSSSIATRRSRAEPDSANQPRTDTGRIYRGGWPRAIRLRPSGSGA